MCLCRGTRCTQTIPKGIRALCLLPVYLSKPSGSAFFPTSLFRYSVGFSNSQHMFLRMNSQLRSLLHRSVGDGDNAKGSKGVWALNGDFDIRLERVLSIYRGRENACKVSSFRNWKNVVKDEKHLPSAI